MSRHGVYAEDTEKVQVGLKDPMAAELRAHAAELSEKWGTKITVAAIFRHAVKEYLAKPVPSRKPVAYDPYYEA